MRGASSLPSAGWHALAAPKAELRLHATLENGQCFGWHRQPGDEPIWVGVFGRRLLALREVEDDCWFRDLSAPPTVTSAATSLRDELRDYFQLSTPLQPLYSHWSAADERMTAVANALPGMRILRQEPVECLFSFICSSNNNIARIGGMLQALRRTYGTPIAVADDTAAAAAAAATASSSPAAAAAAAAAAADAPATSDLLAGGPPVGHGDAREFYTFPSAAALAQASETELRALGLGYRASYVRETAAMLIERGDEWLPSLRAMKEPETVRQLLSELPGVGPKVADCVALFSLDQSGAIPVDTHVWDIACRDLDPTLTNCGSLTPKVYNRVGDLFRGKYGDHAGWAHSLLFAAELPLYRGALPTSLQADMQTFRDESKRARQQEKLDRAEAKAAGQPYTPSRPYKKQQLGGSGASSAAGASTAPARKAGEGEVDGGEEDEPAQKKKKKVVVVKRKRPVAAARKRSAATDAAAPTVEVVD